MLITASGSGYVGTFKLSADEEGNATRTGSLVATENSDGTYSVIFTDSTMATSSDALLTLSGDELTGSVSIDGRTLDLRASRERGPREDRGRDRASGSGSVVRERPAHATGSGSESAPAEDTQAAKPALSEKIRTKLDAKFDAIDESKREEFYRDLLAKLDILLSKDYAKQSQKELLQGVRDHVQSRLDSEFPQESGGDDMLDELFAQ
jgi:hypothetical protein